MVHSLPSSHTMALPAHVPPPHWSPLVQALASLHVAELGRNTHPFCPSQSSLVHGLPSLQTIAMPGLQLPLAHTSPTVHTLPSLHGKLLLLN